MANPQCENGYTKIANEIVEHLCSYRLAGQEWQVLWFIIRKTYGFKKKKDMIALSQFSEATGIDRRKIPALLNSLVAKNIILKTVTNKGDTEAIFYGIQKDYEKWQVSPKKVTAPKVSPKKVQSVPNNGVKSVTNNGAYKRNKNNIQKKCTKAYPEHFENCWSYYPRKLGKKAAYKAYKARLKNGVTKEQLLAATINYANDCKGKEDRYIKHGKTFYGPDDHFQDWLNVKSDSRYNFTQCGACGYQANTVKKGKPCPICEKTV
jgi:phage replication O-like protein O